MSSRKLIRISEGSGDLSSNPVSPSYIRVNKKTRKVVVEGRLFNDLGDDSNLDTRDFFLFKIHRNRKIDSITLLEYDNASYGDNKGLGGWFAVSKGYGVSSLDNPDVLIAGALIGVTDGTTVGSNLLDALANPFEFNGLRVKGLQSKRILAGVYTFWIQEGNFDSGNLDFVDYSLEFSFADL